MYFKKSINGCHSFVSSVRRTSSYPANVKRGYTAVNWPPIK